MTERIVPDVTGNMRPDWSFRGGPGWDYPCTNPHMIECANNACQMARRCRLKDYFALFSTPGEQLKDAKEG